MSEDKKVSEMTELEKLDAGLEYNFWDAGVNARKHRAMVLCHELNALDPSDEAAVEAKLRELFAEAGSDPWTGPGFNCDYGLNIHVGDSFCANYNVTILDIAPVHIGDNVMIGPGCMISTVNHPITPMGRRNHIGQAKPVTIGNDVWLGGNVTVVPGVTIGDNVVVAAGAVVTKDLPSNGLYGGIPAKLIRTIENDVE